MSIYIIHNSAGEQISAIQPKTLDGPGGVLTSSDLRMYGLGVAVWGEGVNENTYRLLENFACPEKTGTPGVPQDRTDLGSTSDGRTNGINTPVRGQLWFNTTQNRMFVFNGTSWNPSGVQPTTEGSAGQILTSAGPGVAPVWTTPAVGATGTVTSVDVIGGVGISSSGGPITTSGAVTVALTNTGVTAGSYTSADITVNAQGRITSAASGGLTSPYPSGMIVLWFGSPASVPVGWQICDGSHGTPNLQGRVVVGVGTIPGTGTPVTLNSMGGTATSSVSIFPSGSHSHTGLSGDVSLTEGQMPRHTHGLSARGSNASINWELYDFVNTADPTGTPTGTIPYSWLTTAYTGGIGDTFPPYHPFAPGNGNPHAHTIPADGSHNHSASSVSVIPPYVGLYYIMKL